MGPSRREKKARCPRSGFDLGSGDGAQAQGKVLGCLGSSTPHDLGWVLREDPGTPLAACSHLLLGWGPQVGPTRHQPGQRAELALLWGDGNHTDTPQWKITSSHGPFLGMRTENAWETRGQRAATKYLGLWRVPRLLSTWRQVGAPLMGSTQTGSG